VPVFWTTLYITRCSSLDRGSRVLTATGFCLWEPLIFDPSTNFTSLNRWAKNCHMWLCRWQLLPYQTWCKSAHWGFWANA